MPDPYMPDVVVEIAFGSTYATPYLDRVYTDVSDYVELADRIVIGVGRQDERSLADANTLTLTLDNTDGRFTAQRAASPYYPNVKIGRPIRVTATGPVNLYSRFVGFIDQWPVEWDGSDKYAKATITASSRLARIGLATALKSMPEEAILASRPARYWTLGDPQDSTSAAESSGNGGLPLAMVDNVFNGLTNADVVFGTATGPGTDELTAAEFSGGDPDTAPCKALRMSESVGLGVARGIRCSIRVTAVGTSNWIIASVSTTSGDAYLRLNTSGTIASSTLTGPNINDGLTHDVALIWDATTAYLVVDGVTAASGSSAGYPTGTITGAVFGSVFSGVLAHAAIWDDNNPPTVAQVQDQAAMMTAAGATESTDQRLVRLLGWAGVTTGITAETGDETMTYQKTSGQSVVDALRDVESTEGGLLFDDPSGVVTFHNRSHRYLSTAAVTLNMASQHVGSDYAPKLDRSTLVNDATVENPTTGETARVVDTASRDEYGVAATSAKSVASTADPLLQKANWLVAAYAEPRNRVPSLTVDVLAHVGLTPSTDDLLGLDIGDLIAVTNAPAQADATTASYFVEGYTEVIGPESYEITFNLSPTHPALSALQLDDATRGKLDTGVLAL